jgi:ribosomal protein L37AE/L43A
MPLTLEKLKALIRLANNNNSEGEANAAARKVCRILVSGEFTVVATHTKTAQEKVFKGGNPGGNKGTWNDVRRSEEPQWRAKPPDPKPPYTSTEYDQSDNFYRSQYDKEFFDNLFRRAGVHFGGFKTAPTEDDWNRATNTRAEEEKRNEEKRKRHASNYGGIPNTGDFKVPFTRGVWKDNPFVDFKETKRQEMRKCAKCGLEIMTYRYKEDPWICNPCHWGEKT